MQPAAEVLVAELSEMDFDMFIEEDDAVKAYKEGAIPSQEAIMELSVFSMPDQQVEWESSMVEKKNWNAEWESSFQPIHVEDQVSVRAPFHDPTGFSYDIIIQPKMSFGTGHHDTTWLMLREIIALDCKGKRVLDMGSGTGVLAILAEKRGAAELDAIDIDEWAKENCDENAALNDCHKIKSIHGDVGSIGTNYDIVLANINRNILLADLPAYAESLVSEGHLLLSGFFPSDFKALEEKCNSIGLNLQSAEERNGWGMMHFTRS